MNITLWGVRGSIPTSSPQTDEYGGNTSCVEIEQDGWHLILDAGTGIQNLNHTDVAKDKRIDILLTHLHTDHIQGLVFFKPLFDPEAEIHIWGPASHTQSLRSRLGRYFSPPLFPVYFRDLKCKLSIHEIHESTFEIGPFTVESNYIIHPGPTVGFRISSPSGVFTYIPDHEPALGHTGALSDLKWLSGSGLASGADLLMHDGQYTSEEYPDRKGWGHSAMEDALLFAGYNKVKHLVLTHHDPLRTDEQLDALSEHLKASGTQPFTFELAVEGSKFVV